MVFLSNKPDADGRGEGSIVTVMANESEPGAVHRLAMSALGGATPGHDPFSTFFHQKEAVAGDGDAPCSTSNGFVDGPVPCQDGRPEAVGSCDRRVQFPEDAKRVSGAEEAIVDRAAASWVPDRRAGRWAGSLRATSITTQLTGTLSEAEKDSGIEDRAALGCPVRISLFAMCGVIGREVGRFKVRSWGFWSQKGGGGALGNAPSIFRNTFPVSPKPSHSFTITT